MPKRRRPRAPLGMGTLTSREIEEEHLHGLFLAAIHRVARKVVKALRTKVLPVSDSRWELPCPIELEEIDALREFSDEVSRRMRVDGVDPNMADGYITEVGQRLQEKQVPGVMIQRLADAARQIAVARWNAQPQAADELEEQFEPGPVASNLAAALFREPDEADPERALVAQQKVAVCSWAQRFNILVDWVVYPAWHALSCWHVGYDEPDDLKLRAVGAFWDLHPELDRSVKIDIIIGEWDPPWERRGAAEERLLKLLRKPLRERLETIEREFKRATGWKRTSTKVPQHLEWVALWRCLGWDAPRIFRKYNPGKAPKVVMRKKRGPLHDEPQYRTIHKAINETEKKLGFTHLPGRSGKRQPRT